MRRIRLPLIFLATCWAISTQVWAAPFVFTAIPDQDETRLRQRFGQIAEYLAEKLALPVQYVPVKSYAAAITAFKNDQVQMAWFGGLSGVRARLAVPGSRAIAQGIEDPTFETYFIAHVSTKLGFSSQFPSGIAKKIFTFGSKGSTSGRLMPEYYIRLHLGAPDEVFSRVGFSGDHNKTIALVQSGAYQVGAVNFKVWEAELAAGKVDTNALQVIWRTPGYPDYNWTVRGDLDARHGAGFTKKVQDALLQMREKKLLEAFPRAGFIPAKNADFEPVLKTAKEVGLVD